jgi:hypothetical protein
MNLDGIGLFIWKISACESGSWEAIVKKASLAGVSWLAVKSGDAYRNNQWSSKIAPDMIKQAHDAGLLVLTWNYSKPTTWAPETHHIHSLFEEGVDGHIIDGESEWEGFQSDAELYLSQLRKKIGKDKFLGYSTFAFYNFHGTFPYGQFGRYCDAVFPQLYWTEQNQPMLQAADLMDKGMKDMAKAYTDAVKPIYPIGSAYGKGYHNVKGLFSTEDMRTFIKRYRGSYPSLYAWDGAGPKVFEAISDMHDLGDLDQDRVDEPVTESLDPNQPIPTPEELAKAQSLVAAHQAKLRASQSHITPVPPAMAAAKMKAGLPPSYGPLSRPVTPSKPLNVPAPVPAPQPITIPPIDIEVSDDEPE